MEKTESHGDAKLKAWSIVEQAKTKMATEGAEARFRAKRRGPIPAKRRLVKRMMWDRVASWFCFALGSCFCSAGTCLEPVQAKKTMVGVAQVLPLPEKH